MKTETRRGTIKRVFFCNPESPFMAGVLNDEDSGGEVRFNGKLAADVGDKVELTGSFAIHPKFGRQFEAQTGQVKMDESPDALVHMLASREEFKGIGPSRAQKIVDAAQALSEDGDFGDALERYAIEIADRAGVKVEIIEDAAKAWNEKREFFEALSSLNDQGWTNTQGTKIIGKYGVNSASILKPNPYILIGKLARFGFKTVDAVASKMGFGSSHPHRILAGVGYCIDDLSNEGHTWTTRAGLIDKSIRELQPDTLEGEDLIRDAVQQLVDEGMLLVETAPDGTEIIASAALAAKELDVFEFLIAGMETEMEALDLDEAGDELLDKLDSLNDGQSKALGGFASRRVCIISGGAGVGKTFTMDAVCDLADANGLRVALCAPTGKAARKLARSTGRRAKTIHKTLDPQVCKTTGEFKFTKDAGDPIDADLIVVDEFSMCDVRLAWSLVRAIKPGARLLLVGDHNQIPSVGAGAILRDLLSAEAEFPKAIHILREIVRQAGVLARNTSAVLDGVLTRERADDLAWWVKGVEKGHEVATCEYITEVVERYVTAPEPYAPFEKPIDIEFDVQILSPMRKGPMGTYAINASMQKLRQRLLGNVEAVEPVPPGRAPKPMVGDRVIWTKNDYDLDLFNGTQAIVREKRKGGALLILTEDGREVVISAVKKQNLEVAWAITIHKAQGSEWPLVILAGSSSHHIMHDRNLLYTGCSRASQALGVVGDAAGLQRFARETKSAKRQTFGSFLVHGWKPTTGDDTLLLAEEFEFSID